MELLLERKYCKKEYTIGNLYINGVFYCNILEDTVRDFNKNGIFDCGEIKIKGNTAIPYGEYDIIVTYSPKFKRELPILLNVPAFDGIRIHRGNTNKDTEGCLLPGENKERGKVINSTKYELDLTNKIKTELSKGKKVKIKIV
jgi:hypothetical protein